MINPITWIIDDLLLERHDHVGFPPIDVAAREAGHNVIMKKYVPFSDELLFTDEDIGVLDHPIPLVTYGCVGFIRQFQKHPYVGGACPGAYLRHEELKYSKAAAMYGPYMLNDDFVMLPYGELRRRIIEDNEMGLRPPHYDDHKMFVRPDVVTKTFAGRVFDFDTEEDDIYALDKYERIDLSELVVIAEPKDIIAEFRHFVVNGVVVAESQYRRDGKLDIRIDVTEENSYVARMIAAKKITIMEQKVDWEPDTVYVVDTAETVDGPRIIEFNSASCSGLYACDTRAIVNAVAVQAWKEFTGDLD
jgi:hypothetical protein